MLKTSITVVLLLMLSGCAWLDADKADDTTYFDFTNKGCEVEGKLSDNTTKEQISEKITIAPDCTVTIENTTVPDEVLLKKQPSPESTEKN